MNRSSHAQRRAGDGVCEVDCLNPAAVGLARRALPEPDRIGRAADALKILANPARLRLLLALRGAELCVCDCAHLLGQSLSAASQHLKELRRLGMVAFRQDGKLAYYRIADPQWLDLADRAMAAGAERPPRSGRGRETAA